MNIGIVCYPTFGGSGVLATELGKALAEKGHNIHFITYQQPVRLAGFHANIFYHEVPVPSYPLFDYPPYETALSSTMVYVVHNYNIDLLHVHYAIPHASSAYIAKKILEKKGIHIPIITTLHGTDITLVGRDKTYRPVVAFSMEESDMLTAVSENLKDETYKIFDLNAHIEVIHNFVDVERFNRKPIKAFKEMMAPNGERIIIHASNFRKVKRVQDVLAAFKLIRKEMAAKLIFIGDGPERSDVETMARECNECHDDVKFFGKQEQMEDLLPLADLFMLPSDYESFGLAALEAMAAEVPVIASDTGGLPEIITNGYNGYLSKVGDVEDMATNAIKILKEDDILKTFKVNALEMAKRFDIHRIVPVYENLYEKVMQKV